MAYSNLTLCDVNSFLTFNYHNFGFSAIIKFLYFCSGLFLYCLSINYTPLLFFFFLTICILLNVPHAIFLHLSSMHQTGLPERKSFFKSEIRLNLITYLGYPMLHFLAHALYICSYLYQQKFHFPFLYTEVNKIPNIL